MQSRQEISAASSAGSSPRKSRTKNPRELVPAAIAVRGEQSALQSAWIRRIIPAQRVGVSPSPSPQRESPWKNNDEEEHQEQEQERLRSWRSDGMLVPAVAMACSDDEEMDSRTEVSGFKLHAAPSSWLTAGNSGGEIDRRRVEAAAAAAATTPRSRGSSGSKVVPVVLEVDEVMLSAANLEKFRMEQQDETHGSARRDRSGGDEIRSFPPLKSGEQWPGTLNPSGLPPLKIPRSPGKAAEQQSLPLLTPVAAAAVAAEAAAPSLIRTISPGSSFTRSLPTNFAAAETSTSGQTRSLLPDRFGFFDSAVRSLREASTRSGTKSLFGDNDAGEEIQSLPRRRDLDSSANCCKDLSRTSLESDERSNALFGRSQHQLSNEVVLVDRSLGRSPQRERSPGTLHSSRSVRGVQGQIMQQQWLHRWCSNHQ